MTQDDYYSAFNKGYDARFEHDPLMGIPPKENPFPIATRLNDAWESGWLECQDQLRENNWQSNRFNFDGEDDDE